MLNLLLPLIVLMGGLAVDSMGLSGGPVDVSSDWRPVELRAPLTAQTGNPRLLVYLRDLDNLGVARRRVVEELPRALPPGSLEAATYDRAGKRYLLTHTGYSFYRGMPGLVLERDGVPRGTTFFRLEVRAARPLDNVLMVWLDSLGSARPEP